MSLTWFILPFQVVIHTIRLPKNSTVGDVIMDLKTKVSFYYYICFHPFFELFKLNVAIRFNFLESMGLV